MRTPEEVLEELRRGVEEFQRSVSAIEEDVAAEIDALEGGGHSELEVALVSCGKAKSSRPAKAQDLYTGLPFRLAMRHARATADDVHILSALHGMVAPSRVLEPYDFSMVQLPPSKHLEWGYQVLQDLKVSYPMQRLRVVFYAGQQYIRPIMAAITDELSYWTFHNPLAGQDLFDRIRWFKKYAPSDVPF